jgi:hypothetical protein
MVLLRSECDQCFISTGGMRGAIAIWTIALSVEMKLMLNFSAFSEIVISTKCQFVNDLSDEYAVQLAQIRK